MRRLVYSSTARRNLVEIAEYIAKRSGNRNTARSFTGKLREQCAKLARLTSVLGRARPELGEGVRSFVFGNYVIVFEYRVETLYVIAVVEGHRDIDRYLAAPDEDA